MKYLSTLEALQKTSNLSELAYLLRVQPKTLSYNIYIIDKNSTTTKKYSEFSIPKKSGGTRVILAPNQNLKFIQSQLSKILYSCVDEISATVSEALYLIMLRYIKRKNLFLI